MTKNSLLFGALALTAILGLSPVTGVVAEEVALPIGNQTARDNANIPRTGMSQASVQARWGDPATIQGPVGDPPISQWHYQDFVVYFEGNHVLHTVLRPQR